MLAITLIIYFGITSVEKIGGWRDKNIKTLHLAEGIILTILGIGSAPHLAENSVPIRVHCTEAHGFIECKSWYILRFNL